VTEKMAIRVRMIDSIMFGYTSKKPLFSGAWFRLPQVGGNP